MTTALDINQFVYRTGTLTIAPGATTATFAGTMLNSGPVKDGDELRAGGTSIPIKSVTSDTQVELFLPWDGDAVTNGQYVIFKSSLLRYHTALAAIDTGELIAMINQNQIIYDVQGDAPDPSIGKEGDAAWRSNVTPWKFWKFLSGEWVEQSAPAEKGDPGEPGTPGAPGAPGADGAAATIEIGTVTTLPAGSPATVTNTGTESAAVFDIGIPRGADGTDGAGTGDMLAANNLSDLANADTALGNLGGTTLGKSLFKAVSAAAARTAEGAVGAVRVRVFTSSDTYVPDPHLLSSVIECLGGGGGGGGANCANASHCYGGAGGGSGSYARKYVTAATIGASQPVTIGGGGGGGSGSSNGGAGGDSSVGSLCVGKGGGGGLYGSIAQFPLGGVGGVPGTGDFTANGARGFPGAYQQVNTLTVSSGTGASSIFGSGATGVFANSSTANGAGAFIYGSGGSGAIAHGIVATATGGAGTNGVIIITEFCSE